VTHASAHLRRWILFFLCATLSGLFLASQSYLLYKGYSSKSIAVLPIVVLALVDTWTWFLLLPGILALADRFPRTAPIALLLISVPRFWYEARTRRLKIAPTA
jgi:hypothetical protein